MTFVSIVSISSAMLCVATMASVTQGSRQTAPAAPGRLAIYYGYPSLVNGAAGNLDRAAAAFGTYDAVVLGDGLELPDAPERAFTLRLTSRLRASARQPQIYGYIDLGRTQQLSPAELTRRIDLWAALGATGIFLDEAGYDFGVTRDRQNMVVAYAHARRLGVMINAFRPEDVFGATAVPLNAAGGGNPAGASPLLDARDVYLLESFAVRNGLVEDAEALVTRALAALDGRTRRGTRIAAVTTTTDRANDTALSSYAWWAAAVWGLDAYGWGSPSFSAVTSQLPWIARPAAETELRRAQESGAVRLERRRWTRATTAGTIVVDPETRLGSLVPYGAR